MDTYQPLSDSLQMDITASLVSNCNQSGSNVVLAPKDRRLKNLKAPWPKGVSGNAKGTKGPRVKEAIIRQLSKRKQADEIAKKLLSNAKSGVIPESTKAIEVILKTEGGAYDKNDTPLVAIQNNTLSIPEEIMQLAREYVKTSLPTTSSIIDVTVTNVVHNSLTDEEKRAEEYLKGI